MNVRALIMSISSRTASTTARTCRSAAAARSMVIGQGNRTAATATPVAASNSNSNTAQHTSDRSDFVGMKSINNQIDDRKGASGNSSKNMTDAELRILASRKSTPLSLANMYRYASSDVHTGQRLRNAQFLRRELPIRLAQVSLFCL